MKPHQRKILKFLFSLFLITGAFLFSTAIFAQDFGVNEVGNEIALPTEDPRVVAAQIIRVALGFLGIIAVAIVLYGGFVWMTAGGNEERISTAKKILTNGLIGLVIIVFAFSITQFVLNRLMEATGITPGGGGGGGPGGGGGGGGLPSDSFVVRGIQPNGAVPIRNVIVRVVFNKDVDATTLSGNLTVAKTADGSLVDGTATASGTVVEFTPSASCPAPNEDRKCFEADTEFTVEVGTGLRSADGRNLVCGGLAPTCRANFTTGNLVDVTGPEVRITYPDPGASVSADAIVSIEANATDDAGVSYLEYFSNGGTLGTDAPGGVTPRDYSSIFDWDTTGVVAGSRHTLTARAFDIDSNNTTSGGVDVIVRAAHCFNGSQDVDETGIDCGGADCGSCDGGSCTSGADCRGGTCLGGVCRTLPTITGVLPNDGAIGNYVTIYGAGFGTTPGQVYFNDILAGAPACPVSATWQNNQIIVVVPSGATDGPIRVVVPPPTGATVAEYTDQTDDERGPTLPNFDVNDTVRPGICSITPDNGEPRSEVVVAGTQFGGTQGTSEIIFGGTRAERVTLWTNSSVGAVVPLVAPATVPVQVTVSGQNSNPVNFRVTTAAVAPRILSFSPTHGPVGEYVTIFGSNFGDETGQVFFKDALGADILAATDFPAACGTDWWKNDQIIVKVPSGATTDILKITTAGAAGGQSDDTSDLTTTDFTVDPGTAGPGICKITPDNGPVGLPVTIDGERFGALANVNFYRASPVSVTPTEGIQISTAVPTAATTGPVNITSGTVTGNSVNFTVQDCRAGAVCRTGEQCCRDGSCAVACAAAAGRGYYFWQFSTGQLPIYPQVVESCSNPPPPSPPSPSPWSGRDGGERVCVNSLITARFTTKINPASINSSNILVESCSDQTCTGRSAVVGSLTFLSTSPTQDGFEFSPSAGTLARNTWYQVTLKSDAPRGAGIQSCLGGVGCPDGGFFLDGDRDGVEGGDYVWRFKTRDSDETCAIGLVGVLPYEMTLTSVGATQDYSGLCYAAEDVCVTINCSAYRWGWSSADVSKATVTGSTTNREVVTARAETEVGRPVRITGEIPSERKAGSGNLTVDFTDPKIVEEWPNCSDACANAEIGAKFNTNMNRASVESAANIHLYIWKCGNSVLEPGEDCDDGNTTAGDGCGATCLNEGSNASYSSYCGNDRRETGEDCDGVPFPARCNRATCLNEGNPGPNCGNGIIEEGEDCDGSPFPDGCDAATCLNQGTRGLEEVSLARISYDSVTKKVIIEPTPLSPLPPRTYFLPNTYYRAVISDQVTSASGVRLTELNYDAVAPAGNDSYSWSFKTKNDTNPCTVDRVAVEPQNAILNFIGATQNYISTPFGNPDLCSPTGQRLGAMDYNWGWTSRDPGVATITNNNNYPSCGNGAKEFGEDCDDGNIVGGDGCGATCLNEGSSARYSSTCGNSRVETGEDCDDGNARSGDGCNNVCQNEGSIAGGSVCGNRSVERGEDCDDGNDPGPGCSATCLNEGTVTDRRVDPYQLAEAIDLAPEDVVAGVNSSTTEIQATTEGKSDSGELTLRCGGQDCRAISPACVLTSHICEGTTSQACDSDADCELGVGRNTCCYFKPKVATCDPSFSTSVCSSGATDVCRNAKISVTFDQIMETASITGNILVIGDYGGSCPEGTTSLALWTGEESSSHRFVDKIKKWLPVSVARILIKPISKIEKDLEILGQVRNLINHFSQALFGKPASAAPASPWCVWPGTTSSVVVSKGGDLVTEASFSPTKAFDGGRRYRVLLLGDNPGTAETEGIRNSRGVALGGGRLYGEYPTVYASREIYQWYFNTGSDVCALNQVIVSPASYVFTRSGETHEFLATARDARGRVIARLPDVYYWEWQDWLSNDSTVVELNPEGVCVGTGTRCNRDSDCGTDGVCRFSERQTATAQNKNGETRILVSAKITADTVLSPRTVGRVISGGADARVFLCENPWPNRFGITGEGLTDETYNFETYYCQDRGEIGFSDDLPSVSDPPIINNPPAPGGSADYLLREYFFFAQGNYCTLSKLPCGAENPCSPEGGSCQASSDAIGIRIYTNKNHLALSDWYLAQGFRPVAPSGKTIDQYQAVEDGRTIYVSAANQPRGADGSGPGPDIYTNVYLISYNEGASQDTIDVYNQLVDNWKFNINLDNDKVCRNAEGAVARDTDGTVISCSADFDCPQTPVQYLCKSPKDKLARDITRLSDLDKIKAAIERYRTTRGYPPKLEAGTYVRGISTSKWDSWAVLGEALGGSLPTDPLNKFQGCSGAYSEDTCWSTSEESYVCPGLSHIYQYRYESETGFYVIGSDLEYMIPPETNPSWHWFRAASPSRIQYEDVCNNTIYSVGGVCGDGIINASEECEPTLANTCSNDPAISCRSDLDCGGGTCRVNEQVCTTSGGVIGRQSRTCNLSTCRWNDWGSCLATCGNGIIDSGEACDRGPGGGRIPGGGTLSTNQYLCSTTCRMSGGYCGDGILQSAYGERCDDGVDNGRYGRKPDGTPYCAIGCVGSAPYCGNTVTDTPQEECDRNIQTTSGICYMGATRPNDESIASGPYVCESDGDCPEGLRCAVCSDVGGYSRVRTSECLPAGHSFECRWGTWSACAVTGTCGNGTVEGGEQCDDGNDINTDACVNCQNSRCGDGFTRAGIESCDAGTANGTPCTAPYGETCNYCSRECTLRTASGPTCGDGTINGTEQCDSSLPSYPASWICINTSNPWAKPYDLAAPICSLSSCVISCATGQTCDNRKYDSSGRYNADSDRDGIYDICDTNDNSDVDGCMDDATNCANVNLRITADTGDAFEVYIDGHRVVQQRLCAFGTPCLTAQINTLSRGRHHLRIVYASGTPPGNYTTTYNLDGTVDFGLDFSTVIPSPAPMMERIGEERSIYFTVR